MEIKSNSIKDIQICFMIVGAYVVYNFMDAGKNMYKHASTGGWVSMLFVLFISIVIFKMIIFIMFTFEGENAISIFPKLFGKNIALFLFFTNGFFYMFNTCANIRVSGEIIKYTVLPNTPLVITGILMGILVLYGLLKGLPTIVRLSEIYGYIGILIILLIAILVSVKIDIYNIRPIFSKLDIRCYLKGIKPLYVNFVGLDILFVLPLYKKNNASITKKGIVTLCALYIFFVFIGTVTIGVMGTNEVENHIHVFFIATRIVNIEYLDFLRRLDGFFYIGWFVTVFLAIIIYGYIATFYLKAFIEALIKRLSARKRLSAFFFKAETFFIFQVFKTSYARVSLLVATLSVLIAYMPQNLQEVMYLLNKLDFLYIFITSVIPIFACYMCWIYTKKQRRDRIEG